MKIRMLLLSGFLNHCNGAEGIHNFGDFCKYRQAKGGTGASPSTRPTLETNKQTKKNAPSDLISINCVLFVLDVSKKWLVSRSWVHLFFLSILHQIYTPQPPIQYTVRFLKAWRPKNQWQWGKIPHIEAKIFMNKHSNLYYLPYDYIKR